MPSVSQRIKAFLSGERGRRLVDQGRQELAKPSTQEKLRALATRLTRRR